MAKTPDWLPGTRTGILVMARTWTDVLTRMETAWGVPGSVRIMLASRITAAEGALAVADAEETRTPVATARCREAFGRLEYAMRDIKRRYFLTPPLIESDYIALGLHPKSRRQGQSGRPTAEVALETFLLGRHELGVKMAYITGSAKDPSNNGVRVWYEVVRPGGAAPAGPEKLTRSFFTKRRKEVIPFGYEDSGSTCYMAGQVENGTGGEDGKGPWGPMTSAVIP